MRPLRRLLPLLCLLLAALVGAQATDVLACGDEPAAAACADAHTADAGLDADCICHLVFVPTASAPAPLMRPETRARQGAAPADTALPEGVTPPLVRPPMG